jgi:hypothetical protein
MHWYDWFDFEHILNAVEGADVKASVVLKRNTDEVGYWILRRFSKLI